jgi:hypothetical protein
VYAPNKAIPHLEVSGICQSGSSESCSGRFHAVPALLRQNNQQAWKIVYEIFRKDSAACFIKRITP